MIGLIFGETDFPKYIYKKIKGRKNYLIIDLTKKKFFKKDDRRNSDIKGKKKPFGYTNNPKYFDRKSNETSENDNKSLKYKNKKKFKNRKRPKQFKFKKFKKK